MIESVTKTETFSFAEFELNSAERILLKNSERVALTPRAFDLLLALVRADGHLVTKEALLDTVWKDAIVEEGNLNRTISSLRKVLGDTKSATRFIETVPKSGYRFVAPVVTDAPQNGATPSLETSRPDAARQSSRSGLTVAIGIAVLTGLAVAGYVYWPKPGAVSNAVATGGMIRLTDSQFNEDQAEWTADNQIRFVRYVSANRAESWVMNTDGTNQRRANEQIKNLLTGGWSPDGKRVVFVKEGEGPQNVYLANVDGSDERKLPLAYPPNGWSPDSSSFLYSSVVDKENGEIFIFDIATGKGVNISNNAAFDADPVFSNDGSEITFISDRDGNKEAYVMNVDGTNVRRLTDHPAVDAFPVLAPDGTQVLFDSGRDGENVDLFLKNVNDNSPPRKVTQLTSNEEHRNRCWSPDGTKLVITSDAGGKNNIYIIDVEPYRSAAVISDPHADLQYPSFSPDGAKMVFQQKHDDKRLALAVRDNESGETKAIYQAEPNANLALMPKFSPDGRHIVFANILEGNTEICLIPVEGGPVVNLTKNAASDASPAFTPDGGEILFQSNRDGNLERFQIFRMNTDGSQQRRITTSKGYEFSPVPLANGSMIFSGDRIDLSSKSLDIRLLDLAAPENEQILASRRFHDSQPAVSSDGIRIAFVAQSDGNNELYMMNIDGSGLVRLTRNTADDMSPRFSIDGNSIYFSSDRSGRYAIYRLDLN